MINRTGADIIQQAFQLLGAFAIGEEAAGDEGTEAFKVLQDFLAEIGMDAALIPSDTVENFTLSASTASYTIGEDSADVSKVRPEDIINAWIRDSSDHDHPVTIIKENRYNALPQKTTENRPYFLWYNPTAPNGTIYLYPTPSTAEDLYIVCQMPFVDMTATSDNLFTAAGIPRGYTQAIVNMYAIRVAPKYGLSIPPEVIISAEKGEDRIIALNVKNRIATAKSDMPRAGSDSRLISGEIPE